MISAAYSVSGVFEPVDQRPGFRTPIFQCNDKYYLQMVGSSGRIEGFEAIDPTGHILPVGPLVGHHRVSAGDPAVFVFAFSKSDMLIGARSQISAALRTRLNDVADPFARLEAADFARDSRG